MIRLRMRSSPPGRNYHPSCVCELSQTNNEGNLIRTRGERRVSNTIIAHALGQNKKETDTRILHWCSQGTQLECVPWGAPVKLESQSTLLHTNPIVRADDQMVNDIAVKQFARLNNLAVARQVLRRWRRIPARMRVSNDHRGSILSYRITE
jgi:hypothetical protein